MAVRKPGSYGRILEEEDAAEASRKQSEGRCGSRVYLYAGIRSEYRYVFDERAFGLYKRNRRKMNNISLRDPQVIGAITAAGLCLGGVVLWTVARKRPTEDELERLRREALVKTGRIIDGTILDTSEYESPGKKGEPSGIRQMILYKYEIAGVAYECSQDVTHLKEYVDIHDCRLAFPCSVRYEPRRPSNSIVVAENWSGLRGVGKLVAEPEAPLLPVAMQAPPQAHGDLTH